MSTVLITGASRGIGAACATAFAEKGWNTFINYNKSEEKANALCASLVKKGGSAVCRRADVRSESEVSRMFSLCEYEYGGADALVCNAGISQIKPFEDISPDEWDSMLEANLKSVYLCIRRALPYMKQNGGRIVTVSSIWGVRGGACEAHYSAAKAGVIGLTKALASELAVYGITVNCVAPGAIDTEMNAGLDRAALAAKIPLRRLGTPEEVAAAVLFLCSEGAGYITGQVLGIDGGM